MSKKNFAAVIVLTFSLLLTTPAFADSMGSAAKPVSSGLEVTWIHGIDSWLQSLIARIGQALLDLDSKPGKPESSDPGMTLVPMGGADGDPNG